MTAAVSIARWLFSEGSGTSVADDENTNDLTIVNSGYAWTTDSGGDGVDFTDAAPSSGAARAWLEDVATNGNIGDDLAGATEASMLLVVDNWNSGGYYFGMRAAFLGISEGEFAINNDDQGDIQVRWAADSDYINYPNVIVQGAITDDLTHVIAIVVDTTQGTAADRIKIYLDGSSTPLSHDSTNVPQNTALDSSLNADTAYDFSIGDRPTGSRNIQGAVYYCELFTGQLTTTEVSDSYDALIADHDANWVGGASFVPIRNNINGGMQSLNGGFQ